MNYDPRNESDRAYERYELSQDNDRDYEERDIPSETMEYVDTVQEGALDTPAVPTDPDAYPNLTEEDPNLGSPTLEDIPDADDLYPDSPVDPAAPAMDEPHGTDLLNGAGGEEGRRELAAESEDPARPLITDGDRETEPQNDLVTERDTDPENGLFREGSFPASMPDEVQRNLIDSETDQGYKDEVYTDEDE